MDPEEQQPGLLSGRIFGIPTIIWIGVIALGAYIFISRRSAASSPGTAVTESGGGGSARSTTTIDRGAVRIDISQNPQPKPKVFGRRKQMVEVPDVIGRQYTAGAETLQDAGLRAKRGEPNVGKVTSEKPKAGAKVKRGSVVTLSGQGNKKGPPYNVG